MHSVVQPQQSCCPSLPFGDLREFPVQFYECLLLVFQGTADKRLPAFLYSGLGSSPDIDAQRDFISRETKCLFLFFKGLKEGKDNLELDFKDTNTSLKTRKLEKKRQWALKEYEYTLPMLFKYQTVTASKINLTYIPVQCQ